MVHLRKLFRQIITLIVLIGLVAITLWLVGNQRQPPTPLAAQTTEPSQSTVIPSATLTNPPPRPTSTPTDPTVGYTLPSVGVVVTLISPPTPAPSPTPTPTFEPLSDKPIMGFVFKPPEKLPGVNNDVNFDIVGWVPGSAEEMIVTGDNFMDVVNIRSGKTQRFAQWNAESHFIVGNPVWLQPAQKMVFILGNLNMSKYELWINASGEKLTKSPVLANIDNSFVPLNIDAGLGVYDLDIHALVSISDKAELLQTKASPLQTQSIDERHSTYRVLQQPSNNWVVYYNKDDFLLVNLNTRETREINLVNQQRHLWTLDAQWNWDEKLALLLAEGEPPVGSVELYIYDLNSNGLQKVSTPYTHFVDAIAWAPDNQHILINAVIGQREYHTLDGDSFVSDANALFLVDTSTMTSLPIPIVTPEVASSVGEVLWSPDGKYVIARYRFYSGEILTDRVEVK